MADQTTFTSTRMADVKRMQVLLKLRDVPMLASLSTDQLAALAAVAEPREERARNMLFAEGEELRAVFLVVAGEVEVLRHGRQVLTLGAGEPVGEVAVLDERPAAYTAITRGPAMLLALPADAFLEVLDLYPSVARALMDILARRVRLALVGAPEGAAGGVTRR
jgi:CRP-like cAMP-binding protein